ncbi:GntR family transcriptional regulator [Brevibacterium metallidurans]|uniref:GntR family transcriptional regulator n=1 Tax=Brevibacterium metallidurans TaxID=1482676 RepID=A0ABN0SMA2_9MICO
MATASTLTEQVLAGLRTDILAGRFQPGTKLRVSDLSERFQVSASAVREALNRLSEQGLAESLPHRGFRVTPLSIDDLQDLTRARVLLESMLLRESMRLGDLNWEATVVAALHKLQGLAILRSDGEVDADWVDAHSHFHHALIAGAGTTRLTDVAMNLRDRAELYRHWSRMLAGDSDRGVGAEHAEIAELAVARDEAAAEALSAHIERTTDALIAGLPELTPP